MNRLEIRQGLLSREPLLQKAEKPGDDASEATEGAM